MTKKLTRRTVLGGLAGLSLAGKASAEADWPTRTITIIHGFPAGGPSDVIARLIADGLSRSLGQAVIVEPRPGASGTTAAALVARAAPDGYTLSVIPSGHASAAATFANLPYRSVDDFTMITLASEYPYVLATNVAAGIKSVAELIATARKGPNRCSTAHRASAPDRILPSSCSRSRPRSRCCTCPIPRQRAGGDRTGRRPARFHDGPAGDA